MPKNTCSTATSDPKGKRKALPPLSRALPPRKRESALATFARQHEQGNNSSSPLLTTLNENVKWTEDQHIDVYSPRSDPSIYVDQLDNITLSNVRDQPITSRKRRNRIEQSERSDEYINSTKRLRQVHPRSRIHHAQQKHQERQAAAAAAAAAAATATATQTARRADESKQKEAKEAQKRAQKPATATAAAAPVKHNLSESSSHNRRGPEYAYPRDSLRIALRQDDPIPSNAFLSTKSKEKEYWRRQRRVFIRSRFITNDEATTIANGVYKNNPVSSQDRIVVTFQANIANFRSKWRKLLKETVKKFLYISKTQVTTMNSEAMSTSIQKDIRSKVDRAILEKIWGHWIADPFVDKQAFYANSQSVAMLTSVTAKALCVTLQYHYGLLKERDFRKLLDDLDKFTRNIDLPDPLV